MLKCTLLDHSDNVIFSTTPLSVNIQISLDIPCDDAVVIIPYEKYNSGSEILITDNNELVFKGIVDEEHTILNDTGKFKKYVARSMMALLTDNEVYPVELNNPTETYLGYRYLLPFGLDFSRGEKAYDGTILCEKGMSVYDVILQYSNKIYGAYPIMRSNGYLDFKGGITDSTIYFSNKDKGVNYSSFTEYKKPCNRITRVYLKLNKKGYKSLIDNPENKDKKLVRERYVDGTINSKTPAITGDNMISISNRNSLSVRLVCPFRLTNCIGYEGYVDEEGVSEYKFTVKEIKYVRNSKAESTILELERRI